jgi:hypothetical protein
VIIVGAISPVDKDFIIMPYQDDEVLVPSRLPAQCFALSRTLKPLRLSKRMEEIPWYQ